MNPVGVAVNAAGTVLYVSDECNNAVREVQLTGNPAYNTITTLVSDMYSPTGLALDPAGDLFIADSGESTIYEIDHVTNQMNPLAGLGELGSDATPAAGVVLSWPTGLAINSSGDVYVTNNFGYSVCEITGLASTAVGNGSYGNGGDTGPAIDAQLANPNGVAVDAAGDIFIADTWNNSVREVNAATGAITTIAGGGTETDPEFSGPATDAQLNNPQGVVVFGNTLYIADSGNNVVRAVDLTTDTITTVAGDGTAGYAVNCAPTSAELDWPIELATDAAGDLFVADNGNNVVDEVTGLVNGTPNIITVAGVQTLDSPSYSGDGGAATSTYLNPVGVAVNSAGTVLYVSDDSNGGVRKVDLANNTISTVAAATDMWAPTDLALDPAGNLFIADSGDGYIQEVAASTGQMTAVAGSGSWGYSGDGGPALDAQMFWPTGLAIDSSGDLFMTDNWNSVIREVSSVAAISPTVSLASSANAATIGQNVTFTATVNPPYLGGNRTSGTVDFDDGTTVLATEPVVSDEAAYTTTTPLALGTHAMTAVYSGDDFHASSTSDEMDQEIDPDFNVIGPAALTPSKAVTYTATVIPDADNDTAGGTMTFTLSQAADTIESHSVSLTTAASGVSFTSSLDAGTYTVTVSYASSDTSNYANCTLTRTLAVFPAPTVNEPETDTIYSATDALAIPDDSSDPTTFYAWAVTSAPSGASDPTFSDNDDATAVSTTATFSQAGTYVIVGAESDSSGILETKSFTVDVELAPASISISPPPMAIPVEGEQAFSATVLDQFGNPWSTQPAAGDFTWSSADSARFDDNVYTAPWWADSDTVTAAATVDGYPVTGMEDISVGAAGSVISATGAATEREDMPYMLTLASAGLYDSPITSWTINWDDGSAAQTFSTAPLPSVVPHVYTSQGPFTISVSATTASTTFSPVITVVTGDGVTTALPLQGDSSVPAGDEYTLTLGDGQTDLGSGTDVSYTVNWGDGTTDTTIDADDLAAADDQVSHVFTSTTTGISASLTVDSMTYPAVGSLPLTVEHERPQHDYAYPEQRHGVVWQHGDFNGHGRGGRFRNADWHGGVFRYRERRDDRLGSRHVEWQKRGHAHHPATCRRQP